LNKQILREMQKRLLRSFLDVLILALMRKKAISGYDVITFVNRKFSVLISTGTVYSTLYLLERDGLVQGKWTERKRMYVITEKGVKTINVILNSNHEIQLFVANLMSGSSE